MKRRFLIRFAVGYYALTMLAAGARAVAENPCAPQSSSLAPSEVGALEKPLAGFARDEREFHALQFIRHFQDGVRNCEFPKSASGMNAFNQCAEKDPDLAPGKKFGLSPAETLMIFVYTGDGAELLNAYLEKPTHYATDPEIEPATATLDQALEKLPSYSGPVLRGATLEWKDLLRHRAGQVVSYPGFTSTSKKKPFPGPVQLIIHSKSGRDLDLTNFNALESEVLFRRGTRFKVLKSSIQLNGHARIELQEVDQVNPPLPKPGIPKRQN